METCSGEDERFVMLSDSFKHAKRAMDRTAGNSNDNKCTSGILGSAVRVICVPAVAVWGSCIMVPNYEEHNVERNGRRRDILQRNR